MKNELAKMQRHEHRANQPFIGFSAVGPSGSGKTFLMEALIHTYFREAKTIAITPHHKSFAHLPAFDFRQIAAGQKPGGNGSMRICRIAGTGLDESLHYAASQLSKTAFTNIVIDDLDMFDTQKKDQSRWLYWFIRQGRFHGARLFFTSLKVVGQHTAIRSQPFQWFVFKPETPAEAIWYEQNLGIAREDIAALKDHGFIEKNPGAGEGDKFSNYQHRAPVSPKFHPQSRSRNNEKASKLAQTRA